MTHSETAIAALFDHEQEQPGPRTRGRERPAPDWGGDELFSSTPRRRRRTRDTGEHRLHLVAAHDDWSAPRRPGGPAGPDGPGGPGPDGGAAALALLEPAETAADVEAPEPHEFEAAAASVESVEFTPIAAPAGRRTVTVTGHPEPRITRTRRPAPTVDQRIGHRPDRIAGWAFALGMLLILIAIVTANAG